MLPSKAAPPPVKKSWYSDLLKKKPVEEDEPEYDLPRYVPTVKTIMDVSFTLLLLVFFEATSIENSWLTGSIHCNGNREL